MLVLFPVLDAGFAFKPDHMPRGVAAQPAGFFYLLPNGARGALISRSMTWMNAFADRLGQTLDRFDLREKLRVTLRRLGAAK